MSSAEKHAAHRTDRDFYDHISRMYDLMADAGEHRARETGERALAAQPGERVLEIGFGTGNSLVNLARQVAPSGKVCGVDISSGMLNVAREKAEREGLADVVDLRIGDARELPYDAGAFDAIFSSFTLELFPLDDVPKVLRQARRVLKDDGRLGLVSMAVVAPGERESTLERSYKWLHIHFPHIVDCQPIDVSGLVRGAGFDIVQEMRMDIWTMPVVAVVAKKRP